MTRPAFTYGEVCAGVGGLSRGLELAGLRCSFHAEIAAFPRRVLRHHWPDTPLLSDLIAISGGRKMRAWMRRHFTGLLLLAGGTPCQDLSVAGKRAGIFGLRSSLYFRFVRLWKVLGCPYLLWENVAGALSSNQGADFALVLSALVGTAVPVPADGWDRAGVVAGPTGVAAWRLLDAQWFGVPQRRLRLFVLGARAGGVDPAEVLLEPEGVRGNPPTRGEAGEGAARSAGDGASLSFYAGNGAKARSVGASDELSATLKSANSGNNAIPSVITFKERGRGEDYALESREDGVCNALLTPNGGRGGTGAGDGVLAFHHLQDPINGDVAPRLGATSGGMGVLGFSAKDSGSDAAYELAPTLRAGTHDQSHENGGVMPAVLAYDTTQITHPENRCNPRAGDPCHPLAAAGHAPLIIPIQEVGKRTGVSTTDTRAGIGIGADGDPMYTLQAGAQHGVVCTTGDITHALTHEGHDASEDGTGRGTPIVATYQRAGEYGDGAVSSTLPAKGQHCNYDIVVPPTIAGSLRATDGGADVDHARVGHLQANAGVPRRLTPLECERLMGWPDGWTDVPDAKGKPASDAVRYKACGNGVVSAKTHWLGERLLAYHEAMLAQDGAS